MKVILEIKLECPHRGRIIKGLLIDKALYDAALKKTPPCGCILLDGCANDIKRNVIKLVDDLLDNS